MEKTVFEVFPTLKITGEMSALLKETEITKSGIEFRTQCTADLFREYKANSKTGNLSY